MSSAWNSKPNMNNWFIVCHSCTKHDWKILYIMVPSYVIVSTYLVTHNFVSALMNPIIGFAKIYNSIHQWIYSYVETAGRTDRRWLCGISCWPRAFWTEFRYVAGVLLRSSSPRYAARWLSNPTVIRSLFGTRGHDLMHLFTTVHRSSPLLTN